jgi:hypothetical protein
VSQPDAGQPAGAAAPTAPDDSDPTPASDPASAAAPPSRRAALLRSGLIVGIIVITSVERPGQPDAVPGQPSRRIPAWPSWRTPAGRSGPPASAATSGSGRTASAITLTTSPSRWS